MGQLSFEFTNIPRSVSEITRYLRQRFEEDEQLQDLRVSGEISNFSRPSSGHLYFTLKDSAASLRCVMWRNAAARLQYIPRDGDAVEVHGAIGIYESGGTYQLYADEIRPAGAGQLFQEFLRLKARLEAEGLFAPEHKRLIPAWPHRIGIVTSPTAAAIRDMLNTLKRRFPLADVILSPTPVQGDDAPPGIVKAIQAVCRLAQPDVILLARGGGSIEDLWAFNDERVARAIYACPVPVISGVGHETDFTIADFVADLRAPTPTAAAELATPNQIDLRSDLSERAQRLNRTIQAVLDVPRWQLNQMKNKLEMRSPAIRLRSERQRLDELDRRSGSALLNRLKIERLRLGGVEQRLGALNPQAVLQRGYAMLVTPQGSQVSSVDQAQAGDSLRAYLSDGHLNVHVEDKEKR